jgi:GNAT superfamily N-acetyltransferase
MKRIHRIVVKPDYQGIGLGTKFMSEVAKKYKNNKMRVTLVTSSPAFIHGLQFNKNWIMTRKPGRIQKLGNHSYNEMEKSNSSQRLTATFEFV